MTRRICGILLGLLLLMLPDGLALAQQASLRGFVTDAANGEPLEFVNIALLQGDRLVEGAITNRDGLYLIPGVTPGRYRLRASFVGYVIHTDTLDLASGDDRTLHIALRSDATELDEVLVESERTTGAARVTAGQQTIRPADIELIPAPDVSGDLATLLVTLPGVVSTGDRGGQLFIRGGEPTQNLVLLDGILLYQPFHVLGFYSAFPADMLSRTDVYAGGFGSRYGERISSVIDVSTRNGNNQRFAGSIAASPFVSAARVEGPLVKNRISLLVSGRQSLVEEGAAQIVGEPLPFIFGDVMGKLHAVLSENQRASITALRTYDRGTLGRDLGGTPPDEIRWENEGYGGRYLILPNRFPVLFEANLSYSRLASDLGPRDEPIRSTAIENAHALIDATFYGKRVSASTGMSIRKIRLSSDLGGLFQNLQNTSDDLLHWSLYLEPEFDLGNGLKVRPGLRTQFFDVRFAPFFEPRFRLTWEQDKHQFSAAGGLYEQVEIGLNDRRDAASIFTAWTNAVKPSERIENLSEGRVQRAWHALLGYRATPAPWLELSVESFYKDLSNLFIGEWTAFPRFTTNLQPASGRSFGFDLRAEVRRNNFYGYLTYGYSNTRYRARQAELELWYGTETLDFRPPHDRRHQLNALASTTQIGLDISVRWEFGSGLPFSEVAGFDGFVLVDDVIDAFEEPTFRRVIYERPFNGTLPTYHRLDVSVERTFTSKTVDLTVQGTLINTYDRSNLFYLDVFTLRRVDQLPLVPSLGLKLTFK